MMGYGDTNELGWLWMLIPTLLLFVSVVFMVWLGTKTTVHNQGGRDSSALSILERRYARGEISAAELKEARRTLDIA